MLQNGWLWVKQNPTMIGNYIYIGMNVIDYSELTVQMIPIISFFLTENI